MRRERPSSLLLESVASSLLILHAKVDLLQSQSQFQSQYLLHSQSQFQFQFKFQKKNKKVFFIFHRPTFLGPHSEFAELVQRQDRPLAGLVRQEMPKPRDVFHLLILR